MTAMTARQPINLADYQPPVFTVTNVALVFELDPAATIVNARLDIRRRAPGPLRLDGKNLSLLSIAIDGEAFEAEPQVLAAA